MILTGRKEAGDEGVSESVAGPEGVFYANRRGDGGEELASAEPEGSVSARVR